LTIPAEATGAPLAACSLARMLNPTTAMLAAHIRAAKRRLIGAP
jgi:hypothetical protein